MKKKYLRILKKIRNTGEQASDYHGFIDISELQNSGVLPSNENDCRAIVEHLSEFGCVENTAGKIKITPKGFTVLNPWYVRHEAVVIHLILWGIITLFGFLLGSLSTNKTFERQIQTQTVSFPIISLHTKPLSLSIQNTERYLIRDVQLYKKSILIQKNKSTEILYNFIELGDLYPKQKIIIPLEEENYREYFDIDKKHYILSCNKVFFHHPIDMCKFSLPPLFIRINADGTANEVYKGLILEDDLKLIQDLFPYYLENLNQKFQ